MVDLSIIIPVYNCAPYLKKGFERLKPLYQLVISFEIIYVNDGSTDYSLNVLKEIESNNDFVKVVTQENQGSSGARNTAIEIANGNYIQFLDADDFLDIDKIIYLLKLANLEDLDLLGYRLDYVNENDEVIGRRKKHPLPYNQLMTGSDALIKGYHPSSICVFLFKRRLLIDKNLRIYPRITHMDVEFMTRVMINVEKVIFKDIVAYHYLQRPGSITKPQTKEKLESMLFDEVIISKLIKDNIKNYDITDKKLIEVIRTNSNSTVWYLLHRFFSKPNELDKVFKKKCIQSLKEKGVYPIRGPLKTNFQKITTPIMQFWFKIIL